MISIMPPFSQDDRGQAYTLEAILGVLLLFSVILFIAPSFAAPTDNTGLQDAKENELIEQEVAAMLEQQAANGQLKAALLDYNQGDNNWVDSVNTNDPYYFRSESIPNDFGERISEIEAEHDVVISVYLIPETNASASPSNDPDRIPFLTRGTSINNVDSESITITFYNEDRIGSPSLVHTRHGTALPQDTGSASDSLANATNYPIPEAVGASGDGTVYNTVTVRIVIDNTEL